MTIEKLKNMSEYNRVLKIATLFRTELINILEFERLNIKISKLKTFTKRKLIIMVLDLIYGKPLTIEEKNIYDNVKDITGKMFDLYSNYCFGTKDISKILEEYKPLHRKLMKYIHPDSQKKVHKSFIKKVDREFETYEQVTAYYNGLYEEIKGAL